MDQQQAANDEHALVPVGELPEEGTTTETVRVTPERPAELLAQLGTIKLSRRQRKLIEECRATPEVTSIKPTGEVYVSAVHYRDAMNRIFGPLQWALRPLEPEKMDLRGDGVKGGAQTSIMYQRMALVVDGTVVGWAIGECPYHPKNARMTYGDAAAGVQSNALMRLCKPVGIYADCWDARYGERFRREHCVQVWLDNKKARPGDEESNRPVWRRVDAEPFYNERDITRESPNQQAWQEQRSRIMRERAGVSRGERDERPEPGMWERAGMPRDESPEEKGRPQSQPSVAADEPQRILAVKEAGRGWWCVRAERDGDCYTDDPGIFGAARAACNSNSPVRLATESRTSDRGRKFRAIVEILPPRARDDEKKLAGEGGDRYLFDE
jgi:hypothetical protein